MSTSALRTLFAAVFAATGFVVGREAFDRLIAVHVASAGWLITLTLVVPVIGALIGVAVAPSAQALFETELRNGERALERLSPSALVGGGAGLIAGLVIAFLIKSILFEFITLAGPGGTAIGVLIYVLLSVFAGYLGARAGAKQRIAALEAPPAPSSPGRGGRAKLLDTSVIVDGRIVELVRTGFLDGPLVLPRFVLRELHLIADSAEAQKRARGRRGLDVLTKLQELTEMEIDETHVDAPDVDAKLVRRARERGASLVTNDYNLSRVAKVEGVAVLSVAELAGALRPVVLADEELHVTILREGREPHQGLGYLEDGTMVVVENARRSIGRELEVVVTSVLHTTAGRMIFAKARRDADPT